MDEDALRKRGRGLRVLVVEDNPVNREIAVKLLADAGFVADMACDGVEAVNQVATTPYDMVLMDVHMPRLDGLQATRAIRGLPGHAETPILAMSASTDEDDRRACLEAGMSDHITKPVVPERLYTVLLRWLPDSGLEDTISGLSSPDAQLAHEQLCAGLAAIDGFDFATAIEMALHRVEFLVQLLRLFSRSHGDDAPRVRQLLAAGDHEALGRIAHGLKGAAATVGAARIAARADFVQATTGRSGEIPVAEATRLADELEAFLAAVQRVLDPAGSG